MAGFHDDRSTFEQVDKIVAVTNSFLKDGRLLEAKHNRTDSEIEWAYLFRDKQSFKAWNRMIYSASYFKRGQVPSKYNLQVSEGYA